MLLTPGVNLPTFTSAVTASTILLPVPRAFISTHEMRIAPSSSISTLAPVSDSINLMYFPPSR